MFEQDRNELEKRYFLMAKELEQKYPTKSFKNHCYWRIALDQVMGSNWSEVLERPAYKKLSAQGLAKAVSLLESYLTNEELLAEHNEMSLQFRK
jgi:hypothetical protein